MDTCKLAHLGRKALRTGQVNVGGLVGVGAGPAELRSLEQQLSRYLRTFHKGLGTVHDGDCELSLGQQTGSAGEPGHPLRQPH